MSSVKQWVATILVGMLAAILMFVGLLEWQRWQALQQNVSTIIQLLNYNVQIGKLGGLPPPAAEPPPVAKPEPPKDPPKK